MTENPVDPLNPASQYSIQGSTQWMPRAVPPLPLIPGWSNSSQSASFGQYVPQAPIFNIQPNWSSTLSAYGQVGNPGSLPPEFMINPALRQPAPILQAMGSFTPGIPVQNPFGVSTANYAGPAPGFINPMYSGGRPQADLAWGQLLAPVLPPIRATADTSAMENKFRSWMKDVADTQHAELATLKRQLQLEENAALGIPQRPISIPIRPAVSRPGGNSFNDIMEHAAALREEEENAAAAMAAMGGGSGGGRPPSGGGPRSPAGPASPGGGPPGGGGFGRFGSAAVGIGNMLGIGRFTYGAARVGGALGGPGGAAAAAGIAAGLELIYKGANLPLEVGHLASNMFGASQGYTDYMVQLANASRATGRNFNQTGQSWIPNWGQPSPGWGALGITPVRALESLSRIGGTRPGMDTNDFVLQARNLRLSSAYSMLPEGSVEALGQQGLKFGIGTAQNPLALAEQFAGTLETAFARGADRAEVFRQIQSATELVARTSVYAPNTQGMADLMQRMFQVDMPGARSGAAAQRLITGVNSALENPFENPMRAYMVDMIRRNTNWRDPTAVSGLLPGITNTQYGRDFLGSLQGGGSPAFLDKALAGAMEGNQPEFFKYIAHIPNPYGGSSPQGRLMWTQTIAGALGVRPEDVGAYLESGKYPNASGAVSPAPGSTPQDIYKSESEAQVDLLRGMRQHFEVFGKRIDLLNTAFGGLIDKANGAALALADIARGTLAGTSSDPRTLSQRIPGWSGYVPPPGMPGGPPEAPVPFHWWNPGSWFQSSSLDLNPIGTAHAAEANSPQMQQYLNQARQNQGNLTQSIVQGRYPAGTPNLSSSYTPGSPTRSDPRGMEPVIRAAAIKYGIDPDVAMRVAASEGLGIFKGDGGSSFGAFQLHKGGIAGGGNAVGGMGDAFQRATGLDPSDPKNEAATIDFAMKEAAKHGWGAWHGAQKAHIGNREGIGVTTTTPTTSSSLKPTMETMPAGVPANLNMTDYLNSLPAYPGDAAMSGSAPFPTRGNPHPASPLIVQTASASRRGSVDRHDEESSGMSGGGLNTELHAAFDQLSHVVKEVAGHLHELGHGARNAQSGIGTKHNNMGPNASISRAPTTQAAAYP